MGRIIFCTFIGQTSQGNMYIICASYICYLFNNSLSKKKVNTFQRYPPPPIKQWFHASKETTRGRRMKNGVSEDVIM